MGGESNDVKNLRLDGSTVLRSCSPRYFLFSDVRSLAFVDASSRGLHAPPEEVMPDTCRRETITVMSLMGTKRGTALPVGLVCWHRP